MKRYAIAAEPAVEADVEAAFDWYEEEEPGLGLSFLKNFALLIIESLIIHSDIGIFAQEFAARYLVDFPTRSTSQLKEKLS